MMRRWVGKIWDDNMSGIKQVSKPSSSSDVGVLTMIKQEASVKIPAIQEAETRESLEPGRLRLQ